MIVDVITLPLLWLGLIFNIDGRIHLSDAVIGVVAGYLILWSICWLFKIWKGKEGIWAMAILN
ncbi:prepilin peptidase [Abyssogena phaseoliformis symbiont]|uniref:prepilin peptidase n=1 Tax=Abyssogena phaseoliformis symbiont TaxID=596095 RepID=UPI003CCA6DA3